MPDGLLMRRTKAGRLSVRPDVLPELIAILGLRIAHARRALRSMRESRRTDLALWVDRSEVHYQEVEKALRYLIASSTESVSEVEYGLMLDEAKEVVEKLTQWTQPKGRSKPRVPDHVISVIAASGLGTDRPRLPVGGLPGGDATAVGGPPAKDHGPDRQPTPRAKPGRRGRGRKNRE